jgi:hypothetical protein
MEHILSCEAKRSSGTQETTHILCKPKVYWRVYKSPPPVPVLSQINPAHVFPSNFLKIHYNLGKKKCIEIMAL